MTCMCVTPDIWLSRRQKGCCLENHQPAAPESERWSLALRELDLRLRSAIILRETRKLHKSGVSNRVKSVRQATREKNYFHLRQVSARRFNETEQARDSRPSKSQSGKVSVVPDAWLQKGTEREARRRHSERPQSAATVKGGREGFCKKSSSTCRYLTGDKWDVTADSETDAVIGKAHEECPSCVTARCFHLHAISATSSSRHLKHQCGSIFWFLDQSECTRLK